MVKQRWTPQGVLSMGPGWYEDQYLKTLGKLADGPLSFVPWYDPNKKLSKVLESALAKKYPEINLNTNHVYTFEALLVAADAYKRAGSADPKALADAIRATKITDNVSPGPGILFNEKGQNDKLKLSAIQNRDGKTPTVAPKDAANAKVERPEHSQFMLLVAVALIMVNALLLIFGPDARSVQTSYAFDSFAFGRIIVDATKVYAGAAAIIVAAALFAFFRFSDPGKAIRACADNYTGALVVGLNVKRLYALTFGLGPACVGAAGSILVLIIAVTPPLWPQ